MPSRLAQLIAQQEGFYRPGSIPSLRNNPGDLRHSPHSQHPHGANDIGVIDTPQHGWDDLERQLEIYASRGIILEEMVGVYAPPEDYNQTSSYLTFICHGLGLLATATVAQALTIPGQ